MGRDAAILEALYSSMDGWTAGSAGLGGQMRRAEVKGHKGADAGSLWPVGGIPGPGAHPGTSP
jgi:hypothetical protein